MVVLNGPSRVRCSAEPLFRLQANPLDDACEEEGQVVCHQGRIKGQPGVAMDDLVYLCTKLARQMDAAGIDKVLCCPQSASLFPSTHKHQSCTTGTASVPRSRTWWRPSIVVRVAMKKLGFQGCIARCCCDCGCWLCCSKVPLTIHAGEREDDLESSTVAPSVCCRAVRSNWNEASC